MFCKCGITDSILADNLILTQWAYKTSVHVYMKGDKFQLFQLPYFWEVVATTAQLKPPLQYFSEVLEKVV